MKKMIEYYADIMFFNNNDSSLHLMFKKKILKNEIVHNLPFYHNF